MKYDRLIELLVEEAARDLPEDTPEFDPQEWWERDADTSYAMGREAGMTVFARDLLALLD